MKGGGGGEAGRERERDREVKKESSLYITKRHRGYAFTHCYKSTEENINVTNHWMTSTVQVVQPCSVPW